MSGKRNLVSLLVIFAVLVVTLGSCLKTKSAADYEAEEQLKIDDFLSKNPSLTFTHKESGLYFMQTKAGTGAMAQTGDTVYVKYTGKFLDGYVFDTNVGKADLVFPLNANPHWMIDGFEEAMTYMNVGSKATVLIPSKLGYGPYGFYIIGGYTPLIYELELVKLVIKQ
jgi:FKBP-type peptidyl-prolyl cis-trans isomerase